jgi:hypothetical protein
MTRFVTEYRAAIHTIALLALLGTLALGTGSTPKSSGDAKIYRSTTFGFSYIYPSQLVPNTEEFRQKLGTVPRGQAQGQVLFSAFEQPSPGRPRKGVVVTAEDISIYPGNWDAKSCIRKVTLILSKQGWTVLRENIPATIDGREFVRADYQRSNPLLFQSSVCTIWKGNSLNFVFTGGSKEDIEDLLLSLQTVRFQHVSTRAAP